jgi:hypothetical protein
VSRSQPTLRCALAALAGLAGLAAVPATAAEPPFTVTSTLHGKTVLPHRIHWYATASLPENRIAELKFLIDGKARWSEASAPYIYGDPEDTFGKANRGYLVTSFLAPGRHEFTVRATSLDGRTATDTVVARVPAAPQPPARLAGTWRRTIDDVSGMPAPGSAGNPTSGYTPAGTYTMVIEKRWIQVRQPGRFDKLGSEHTGAGWIYDSDYAAGPKRLHVAGAVTFRQFDNEAEGGPWCYWGGPEADYTWSVSGDTLTLTPVGGKDPCGLRGFVWAGEWTRAD